MNPTLLQQLQLTLAVWQYVAIALGAWAIYAAARWFNDLRKAKNELEQMAQRDRKRRVSGIIELK